MPLPPPEGILRTELGFAIRALQLFPSNLQKMFLCIHHESNIQHTYNSLCIIWDKRTYVSLLWSYIEYHAAITCWKIIWHLTLRGASSAGGASLASLHASQQGPHTKAYLWWPAAAYGAELGNQCSGTAAVELKPIRTFWKMLANLGKCWKICKTRIAEWGFPARIG